MVLQQWAAGHEVGSDRGQGSTVRRAMQRCDGENPRPQCLRRSPNFVPDMLRAGWMLHDLADLLALGKVVCRKEGAYGKAQCNGSAHNRLVKISYMFHTYTGIENQMGQAQSHMQTCFTFHIPPSCRDDLLNNLCGPPAVCL